MHVENLHGADQVSGVVCFVDVDDEDCVTEKPDVVDVTVGVDVTVVENDNDDVSNDFVEGSVLVIKDWFCCDDVPSEAEFLSANTNVGHVYQPPPLVSRPSKICYMGDASYNKVIRVFVLLTLLFLLHRKVSL